MFLEDAAGNTATVYQVTITIANPQTSPQPPQTTGQPGSNDAGTTASGMPSSASPAAIRGACNGDPCVQDAKLALATPRSLTRKLAHSALTLKGNLSAPGGAPILGAKVELVRQTIGASEPRILATVTTGAKGRWKIKAPRGPSRSLRVVYYSHQGDTTPVAQTSLTERVPAVISLHAPRTARIGHPLTFVGSLASGHIPNGGEPVQMEILYDDRWRTIEVPTTNSKGRFRYTFTIGGASYRFRAVTVPNGTYPFAVSHSAPASVAVQAPGGR